MPNTISRNVGSGFSTFTWQGKHIALLDQLQDSGQQPITNYQAVTPLGMSYPLEIVTPRVRSEGTLQITLRELWNQPAWWALGQSAANSGSPQVLGSNGALLGPEAVVNGGHRYGPFVNADNIIEIFNIQAQTATPIYCSTIVSIPTTSATPDPNSPFPGGVSHSYRGWTYHNVVLTQVDDSEDIQIGSITVPRTMTAIYTYKTYFAGSAPTQTNSSVNAGATAPFQF